MAQFDREGKISPVSLTWEDGSVYEIDRVLDRRRRASLKAGGIGIRYTCLIRGRRREIYFEDPRWFVEGE